MNAARASTGAMTDAIKTGTLLFVGAAEGDELSLGAILRDSDWRLHGTRNCQEALEFLDRTVSPWFFLKQNCPMAIGENY